MNRNLLNEINQMKFMFGYKAGKVLSEQEERPFTEPEEPKTAVSSALSIYVVKPGDNITKIAQMVDVSVDDIMKSNPQIKDKNKIFPGDEIRIEKF